MLHPFVYYWFSLGEAQSGVEIEACDDISFCRYLACQCAQVCAHICPSIPSPPLWFVLSVRLIAFFFVFQTVFHNSSLQNSKPSTRNTLAMASKANLPSSSLVARLPQFNGLK